MTSLTRIGVALATALLVYFKRLSDREFLASKLDDRVNDVAHEIGIAPFPNAAGWLVYEPMRSIAQGPIRVSWSRRCSSAAGSEYRTTSSSPSPSGS